MFSFGRVAFRERNTFLKFRFFSVQNGNKFSDSKIDLPSPPKRPLTAFFIFCKENRHNLTTTDSVSAAQQTKILARKWSNLDPESRKAYEDVAREDIILYGQAHKEFYENLTEEQREELSRVKAERRESRRQTRLKKAIRESGVPKAPISAYALYLQSKSKNRNGLPFADFSKEMASKWKIMSDVDKQVFHDLAVESKVQFAIEMKKWREKLEVDGDSDLLKAYDEVKGRGKSAKAEAESSKHIAKKSESKNKPTVINT